MRGERTSSGQRSGDPMLDLPLGEERAAAGGGPSRGPARGGSAAVPPPRRRGLLIVLAVVLVGLGAAAGYLLPRLAPPVAQASVSLLDLGSERLGSSGEPRELTLSNGGQRTLKIQRVTVGGEAAADFALTSDACSGARLPAGADCAVAVRFTPTAAGARRASLAVAGNAANVLAVALAGTGTAAAVRADPASLDFGERPVGDSGEAARLNLDNPGTAPLAIKAIAVAGNAAGDFAVVSDRCSGRTLEPSARCSLRVTFLPSAAGERQAGVLVATDAPTEAAPISLVGVGVPVGRPAAEPGLLDFGGARAGATGAERTAHLANRGTAPVAVGAVEIGGPDRGSFAVESDGCARAELAPEGRCDVVVRFRPARAGDQRARLVFRPAGGAGDAELAAVDLAGGGTAPRLAVNGLDDFGGIGGIAFGGAVVGRSAERRVEISNAGTAPLALRRLAVDGDAAGDYRIEGDGCPKSLAPGKSCAFSVRFAPSEIGSRTAVLVVESDAAGSPLRAPLRGTALPPPAPELRVSTTVLRFGSVTVGERSQILSLTLANPGTARLELREVTVTGPAAGDFRVVPGSCGVPGSLVPGSECTVGVRFTPTAGGDRRAKLVVRHNAQGGTAGVDLVGRAP